MTRTIIEAQGITKAFRPPRAWKTLLKQPPPKMALEGVAIEVKEGEIFGLLGPNGAGKTTFVKILVGLLLPDSGTASVDGHDVVKAGRSVRSSIGVVYGDERSFFWRLSLKENLKFYASLFGVPSSKADDQIRELTRLVGLEPAADLAMHSFSTGMRQRAAIARGLINDPAVMVMDEPTRSLDPVGAQELRALIHERVASEGRTVLVATNLMHEAEALCDRLMLIDHGREVVTGTLADFRRQVTPEVVYELLVAGEETVSPEGFLNIPGIFRVEVDHNPSGPSLVSLVMDAEASALPAAIRHVLDCSLDIVSCTKKELSLDEVFRKIVERGRTRLAEIP